MVINPSPVVAFGLPQVCNGIIGLFSDSSTISDGTAALFTYKWNIENTVYTTTAAQHAFANPGNYSVKLVVKSAKGCSDSLTKTVAISSYPVTDFAILTTDFCGNLPLLIKDNSSVNYAGIDRLKVFWNWPATDDTSEFNHPSAGTVYNHTYESFGYQPQRQVNVKVQAYSTGGCYTEKRHQAFCLHHRDLYLRLYRCIAAISIRIFCCKMQEILRRSQVPVLLWRWHCEQTIL